MGAVILAASLFVVLLAARGRRLRLRPIGDKQSIAFIEQILHDGTDCFANSHDKAGMDIDNFCKQKSVHESIAASGQESDVASYRELLCRAAQNAKLAIRIEIHNIENLRETCESLATSTSLPEPSESGAAEFGNLQKLLGKIRNIYELFGAVLESEWDMMDLLKQQYDGIKQPPMTVAEVAARTRAATERLAVAFREFKPTIEALGLSQSFVSIESLANASRPLA